MLTQHSHYVYYDENKVLARRGTEKPVVAMTCDSVQDAHDVVQSIVNPSKLLPGDPSLEGQGFHHPAFQAAISENCRAYVEAAYSSAGK
jgi:hypothetical protein